MHTRRSPRNQAILWKALGGTPKVAAKVDTIAAAERALTQPFLNKRTRAMLERDLIRAKHRAAVTAAMTH